MYIKMTLLKSFIFLGLISVVLAKGKFWIESELVECLVCFDSEVFGCVLTYVNKHVEIP